MCIKSNNFDNKKLGLDKRRKFENNTPVVYHHLTYNYDSHVIKRLYLLSDWIEIVKFNYIYFEINNSDLIKLFKTIHNHIKFPNDIKNNDIQLSDDYDDENSEPKKPFNKSQNTNIDYNNLITINNINNINDIDIEESDYTYYSLILKDKSQLKLIPSKKSGKPEYILDKTENYKEIERYFPTINKKNNNFKVVGKFLIYITVSCYGMDFNGNSFKIYIDSGELKYEKTYVENDILTSKGVYNDMIKLDI